ncbi:MAG: hypothetical protein P4L64_11755 [Caulobacteraceae bacterium]|nr:hypothetical protein [Caulobacteraceae bacterium]
MARKPNYSFERMERERQKAAKATERANAKRDQRERDRPAGETEGAAPDAPADDQ